MNRVPAQPPRTSPRAGCPRQWMERKRRYPQRGRLQLLQSVRGLDTGCFAATRDRLSVCCSIRLLDLQGRARTPSRHTIPVAPSDASEDTLRFGLQSEGGCRLQEGFSVKDPRPSHGKAAAWSSSKAGALLDSHTAVLPLKGSAPDEHQSEPKRPLDRRILQPPHSCLHIALDAA